MALVVPIAGAFPITPWASRLRDLLAGQSEFGQQFVIVLAEQGRGLHVDTLGTAGERERQGAVRRAGVDRVTDVLEETTCRQLRNLGLAMRLHDLGHRNTVTPQGVDDVVAGPSLAPRGKVLIDGVVTGAPARRGAQRGIGRPVLPSDGLAEAGPLVIGGDGHRDPAVGAAELVDLVGAVQVLRRCRRSAVAVALQQRTVGGVLDHLLSRDVDRRIDHRGLDEHSLPGAAPVFQCHQQGVERVDARIRIADRVRLVRVSVGIAGQPTDSGRRLDHVGEGRVVAPRAVETEARHPQHDGVGSNGLHGREIKPDLIHHAGGEVLDDHVA